MFKQGDRGGGETYWTARRAVNDSLVELHAQEVMKALMRSPIAALQPVLLKSTIWAISDEAWIKVLFYNRKDREAYESKRMTAGEVATALSADVARRWKINGVGMAVDSGNQTTYNVIVVANEDEDPHVLLIDPKTDEAVELMQPLTDGIVVFS